MNCRQNLVGFQSQKNGVLQFHGDILVVDGNQVPYGSQMLTNEMLYITDLALQIQKNQQIDQFDQKYFFQSINQQIVAQIQAVHSSIGIQILKQMGNLGTKTYSALFLKLSISKIKHILMDNTFYVFLSATCKKLINGNFIEDNSDATQFERSLLNCLETPQKRVLYLLDSLRRNQVQLRPAIEQTAQQFIFKILGQAKFLQQLGYSKKNFNEKELQTKYNRQIINSEFLKCLCEIVKTLQSLATTPKQIKQVYQFSNYSILSQLLFTKQCLNMIGKHFQYFFLYDRKRLMLILSLLSIHSNKQLWFEIISQKNQSTNGLESKSIQYGQIVYTSSCYNQQETKRKQHNIYNKKDNIDLFSQLILSNFYDSQSQIWDMSIFILLQLIQANIKESSDMLSQIFMQIIQNRLNFDDVALISQFVTIQTQNFQYQQDQHLKLLTYTLFTHIGIQINSLFKQYRRKEFKRFPESKILKIIQFTGYQLLKFPKINSLKICAFLRVFIVFFQKRLVKWSIDVQYVLLIEKLLIMTKGRGGIVQGVRKILIKQIECYIKQRQSQEQKSAEVKQSILTNRMKSFKISIPKQNPNSLDKLKKLLRI